MSWLSDLSVWWRRAPKPAPPPPVVITLPTVPTPGPVRAINYWRALQLLKNTPFLELWKKTRQEIPGVLVGLAFLGFCLFACVFTVGWFVNRLVRTALRGLTAFVRWVLS